MLKINDIVICPFQSIGVIREILNIPWGFDTKVEIISTNGPIHTVGMTEAFKQEQLKLIDSKKKLRLKKEILEKIKSAKEIEIYYKRIKKLIK